MGSKREFIERWMQAEGAKKASPAKKRSITIDADLLRAADIRPNEAVLVLDIDNAARFETYVIRGEAGSGVIGINGAAAKLVEPQHKVIIVCFGQIQQHELDAHQGRIVLVDQHNRVTEQLTYDSLIDEPATVR